MRYYMFYSISFIFNDDYNYSLESTGQEWQQSQCGKLCCFGYSFPCTAAFLSASAISTVPVSTRVPFLLGFLWNYVTFATWLFWGERTPWSRKQMRSMERMWTCPCSDRHSTARGQHLPQAPAGPRLRPAGGWKQLWAERRQLEDGRPSSLPVVLFTNPTSPSRTECAPAASSRNTLDNALCAAFLPTPLPPYWGFLESPPH